MQLKEASILLVDDEPMLRDIMSEWFDRIAGRVLSAADGVEALEILAAHKIDFVITDVRMPVMDGIALLKKIKAGGQHTPHVIFVTGFADISARDAYDLGAEALLEKPLELDDLIDVVKQDLLEPHQRWRTPLDLPSRPILRCSFVSLDVALHEHGIAFGRGGFCVEMDKLPEEGDVNLELIFRKEDYLLSGQGIVRWLAPQEHQIGIELTYVAETSHQRLIELTQHCVSFIPRTTGRIYAAQAG